MSGDSQQNVVSTERSFTFIQRNSNTTFLFKLHMQQDTFLSLVYSTVILILIALSITVHLCRERETGRQREREKWFIAF